MILYGRYMSPFVRRVAIWLNLQGRAFEHQSLQVRGPDFDTLRQTNPLGRVPALKLDDGTVLIETFAIIDYLEETAPADRRLLPPSGAERMRRLQGVALSNSLAEKAVSLSAEKARRPAELHWRDEISRIELQIGVALDLLEAHTPDSGFSGASEKPDGATVAAVCGFDFTARLFPDMVAGKYPRLHALSGRANALPEFGSTNP